MITCQTIIDRRRELWEQHHNIERDREYREAVAQHILDNEHIRQDIRAYPERLIEMCFVIVDKDKSTVPFFLNDVQRDFIGRLNQAVKEYKAGQRLQLKFLILKGRQQGFTSFITAYQLACTILRRNFEGFTAADEDGNTAAIFENKAKHVYSLLPDSIKPTEKYNNRRQLLFERLHSSWEVKTASSNMGRSRTINFFHGSEAAFWRDGISGTQAGIGEALTKGAIVIYESTANGYNEFKELWDSETWINCFYEWWRTGEYRMRFESTERRRWFERQVATGKPRSDGEDEPDVEWIWQRCFWLIHSRGLEWEQVYWYYVKYDNYIDKDLIKQEYPCSPLEAFLASGRPRFDLQVLQQYLDQCVDGVRGYLERKAGRIVFVQDPTGQLEVWKRPRRTDYYIGADTSRGLATGDFSAAPVFDGNYDLNALWHGKLDPDLFGGQLVLLGEWYREALVAVEENNHGLSVLNAMKADYWNLYKRTVYDKLTDEPKQELGWWTTEQTKKLAIDNMAKLIRQKRLGIKSRKFIQECMTYVIEDDGKTNAAQGSHDDVVMAAAIILYVMEQYAVPPGDIVEPAAAEPVKGRGYVRQADGSYRHASEIEDERSEEENWLSNWGG